MKPSLSGMLRTYGPAALLLLVYLPILVHFRGNFELTSDDGMWVLLTRTVVEQKIFTLTGVMGSQGGPNSSLGVYLGAIPYAIHPSIHSICAGVLAFVLLTHVLLLLAGQELRDLSAGVWASLLFFFAPAFFVFYNQKLWQVAYLPFFSTLTLLLALRYVKTRRWQTLAGAYLGVGLCIGLHQGAMLLLPTVLFLPALLPRPARPGYRQMLACLSLLMLSLAHLLTWAWTDNRPALLALGAVLNLPLLCVRRGIQAERWFAPAVLLGPPLALAAALAVVPDFHPLAALGRLIDLLPAFNAYIARHVAGDIPVYSPWLHSGGRWLSLPVAVFLAYIAGSLLRWRTLSLPEKVLFCWNWTSLWLLALSGLFFREHPHQWFVFLFPAPFLAIALTLRRPTQAHAPRLRWAGAGLLAALLASYLAASSLYARFVETSGGISWHMANLSVKLEALSWIYSHAGGTQAVLAEDPRVPWHAYGRTGWTAAAWGVLSDHPRQPPSGKPRVFYIHEPLGLAYNPELLSLNARHSAAPPERFHSVQVFSLDRELPLPGEDVEVLSVRLSILPFLPLRGGG
ncbi:MAG: hypothetical protein HY926_14645 [Elusimicrobia bacterium]|nr:hypothetical protein [Elusimicrobiota bacterium]